MNLEGNNTDGADLVWCEVFSNDFKANAQGILLINGTVTREV